MSFLFLLLLGTQWGATVVLSTNVTMCDDPHWNITFNDEFQGNQLNPSYWTVSNNFTHGATEKQLYLNSNVQVANGTLILTTKKETAQSGQYNNTIYNYTSGWVDSKHKVFQKYGRFEVRAKLPSVKVGRQGKWPVAWPAHWLMPEPDICWPMGGEIDIMEAYRPTPSGQGSMIMTYHWADKCGQDLFHGGNQLFPNASNTTVVDWSNEFHTFGVEWSENAIEWYVDGVLKHVRRSGSPASLFVPSLPFYMILNTAMEPWGDADLDHGLPAAHVIDRVTFCKAELE